KTANPVGVGTPRATIVTVRCPGARGSGGALAAAATAVTAIAAATAAIEALRVSAVSKAEVACSNHAGRISTHSRHVATDADRTRQNLGRSSEFQGATAAKRSSGAVRGRAVSERVSHADESRARQRRPLHRDSPLLRLVPARERVREAFRQAPAAPS